MAKARVAEVFLNWGAFIFVLSRAWGIHEGRLLGLFFFFFACNTFESFLMFSVHFPLTIKKRLSVHVGALPHMLLGKAVK